MFLCGKTLVGKYPRPQPTWPLGAIDYCKRKILQRYLQESFSQSIIEK
jgi:hypothetical protein